MTELLLNLHDSVGDQTFLLVSALFTALLCFVFIPHTTDWMVNSAAGLAEKYLGKNQRTLVINCSTNNPELFSVIISFMLLQVGGIANPLGSNFANIYLMFIVALLIVLGRWSLFGHHQKSKDLIALILREKRLWFWHFGMALMLFGFSATIYWVQAGSDPFGFMQGTPKTPTPTPYVAAGVIAIVGIAIFLMFEKRQQKARPELFEEITDDDQTSSWLWFILGTAGLILCCYTMNSFFLAWTHLYQDYLSAILGVTIFAGLHYFLGALITSLPETKVAIDNYRRMNSSDLNTALGSASYSNMTNLAIGAIACFGAAFLMWLGWDLVLS